VDVLTGLGLSIPAGLNAYIPLLAVALAERFGWLSLREPFDVLGTWWMIAIITVLLVIEIVADKIPAVDHVNDMFQSIIRPAAGAIVAVAGSGNASEVNPWVMVVIGVLLAGGMHAAKATARPVINASTAGVGAAMVSTAEDAGAVAMSAIAIAIPILVIFILAGLLYVLWRMWRHRRRKRREAAEKEAAESAAAEHVVEEHAAGKEAAERGAAERDVEEHATQEPGDQV
jgi:uncharacterized membrane protein